MKKIKYVLVFLCFCIYLTACNDKAIESENINNIQNQLVDINIYSQFTNNDNLRELEQFFLDNYNIKLKLNSIDYENYNFYNYSDGLFSVSSTDFVKLFYDNEQAFKPITTYIKDSTLPRWFFNSVNLNKEIWALPKNFNIVPLSRFYNSEVLKKLNMNIPSTTDDLMEYIIKSSQQGVKGIACDYSDAFYIMSEYRDVFFAYGFPIKMNYSIAYNPHAESFEDNALSPDTYELLTYIKSIYNGNYSIKLEDFKDDFIKKSTRIWQHEWKYYGYDLFREEKIASKYGTYDFDNKQYTFKREESVFLTGKYEERLIPVEPPNQLYVLTKASIVTKEQLNQFINVFYNNKQAALIGHYGLEGDNFSYNDNFIIPINKKNKIYPNIVGNVPWYYIPHVRNEHEYENNKELYERIERHYNNTTKYDTYVEDNIVYYENVFSMLPYTYDFEGLNVFSTMLPRLFKQNISVNDFILEYKSAMKKNDSELFFT